MTILEITPFDILTAEPGRIMSTLGFWAGLPRLTAGGASTVRLLMVADNLDISHIMRGFSQVAVPQAELPSTMRWYRSLYEEFLHTTIQQSRYMKLYFIARSGLSDHGLCQFLKTYNIIARPLDHSIPLPFTAGKPAWNRLVAEDGGHWAIVRSKVAQVGAAHPRIFHRLFALEFPVWLALDIMTYTTQEGARMLQHKEISAMYDKSQGAGQAEAADVRGAVTGLRHEINRLGAALHTIRLSVVTGASSATILNERLEMVRGACGMELEGWEAPADTVLEVFSAEPAPTVKGALISSTGLSIVTGSAFSYRRRTETRGIFLGTDRNQSPIVMNLFDDNNPSYNVVVLGQTGAGKTFSILLLMLRHLLMGVRLIIIDPQGNINLQFLGDEIYHKAVLGTEAATINILDIIHDEIAQQVESVNAILSVLGVSAGDEIDRAIVDEVLMDIYTPLWGQPIPPTAMPTLAAVKTGLERISHDRGRSPVLKDRAALLAYFLTPYVSGSRAALFGKPTTVDFSLSHPVTVYDVSRLPKSQSKHGNLRTALLSILVGDVNQAIRHKRQAGDTVPIIFFIDEMGVLMRDHIIAAYASEEYKTARARRVAMIVADQDLHSFLGPADESGLHHGVPMLANAAFTFIFLQKSSEKGRIKTYFPDLPQSIIESLPLMPQGACVAKFPNDLLQMSLIPSEFEKAILSSKLEDRQRAAALMQQMVTETFET